MLLILFFWSNIVIEILAESPSVIIIGAGPSGIAAATRLLENSITNITILEAEDRIGGRIHSIYLEDGYVDLGAEFCHGEVGNVVYEAVKDLDLLQHSASYASQKIYQSDGTKIEDEFEADILQFLDNYEDWIDKNNEELSLHQNVYELYNTNLVKKYEKTKKHLMLPGVSKLLQHVVTVHEGVFSSKAVSAGKHYTSCAGDQEMIWKNGGYHTILNILMKKFPNINQTLPLQDKIVLNKEVTKISWQGKKAEIKTSDNTTYTADHIVFTPSVGVLKHSTNIFTPSLPKNKLVAIDCIGLDAIMKIILHYPEKWWNTSFFFSWSAEDLRKSAKEFSHGYSQNGVSWVTSVFALDQTANPNVLIALVTGEMVPQIEEIPEDVISDGIEFLAKKFLSKSYNITKPDKVIRSQWYLNPHFRGTYSFEKFGCFKKEVFHQVALAEPLYNTNGKMTLQFAGEATNSIHYSTVHGAIETGWREAERIIAFYKNK